MSITRIGMDSYTYEVQSINNVHDQVVLPEFYVWRSMARGIYIEWEFSYVQGIASSKKKLGMEREREKERKKLLLCLPCIKFGLDLKINEINLLSLVEHINFFYLIEEQFISDDFESN